MTSYQVYAAKMEALLRLQRYHEAEITLIDSPTFQTEESTKFFGPCTNSYILTVCSEIYMSTGRSEITSLLLSNIVAQ